MRTEVEGEDAPQPGDRNNEASFTQNAQNTPSETSGLSDIKQKPEAIPGDNTEELANAIPNDGGEHPDKWIKGIPLFMAIPQITNQFHSLQDIAWYGSAYTLASSALQPLTGKFYTYFTSKWVFLGFFTVFELGSLICGVATSSKMLIVGRAIAGMGSSGMSNGALTIVAGAVPLHKRPFLVGIMMGLSQVGLILGPLIGGAFTTYTTWRWCFYINLPIGALVAALLIFTRIPEQREKGRAVDVLPTFFKTFDIFGFVLFAPAAIQLLLALEYGGNEYAWDSATVIGLFCGAGATFLVFTAWEHRMGKDAMIPFHVIRNRIVSCSCVVIMFLFGMTITASYYLPIYFQAVRDKSALVSGVDLLPGVLCQIVMALVSGALTGRIGYYLPFAVLGGILNSVGCGLLSTLSPTTPTRDWAGYQALIGFGRGAAMQTPMIAVQNAVLPDELSTAMAILTFSQTIGAAIFLAAAEVIFSHGLRSTIPKYAPTVDSERVIAAGATGFRRIVSEASLPGVLVAYSKSIGHVFYLIAALSVLQFFLAWGMGWKNVSKPKEDKSKGEEEGKVNN
ncbi:hypothetical protein KXV68_004814 [Aspergillus fumigatus]|nr:hypothetical protein KXX15_004515 [Aspergillus fumigatus]KAH2155802.1 hypothetical protein KXV68_004814 [Aspergillus fumigatus]KAH2160603.1 hypothetical protein KXW33_004634 [Aspergillus fumigatus]KAH2421915.1 hypothetical protein KXV44_004158 [Aspergillus fumigatus]KAH2465701.1 hypothetical protein KXW63_004883 [Aspergillus fumigatus]